MARPHTTLLSSNTVHDDDSAMKRSAEKQLTRDGGHSDGEVSTLESLHGTKELRQIYRTMQRLE